MIQLSNMMLETVGSMRQNKYPNKIMLGQLINKFASGYKIYGEYFGRHPKSATLLSQMA